MSKEEQQKNNQSEEIDLGQLFKAIGNGFRNFSNGIANIFKRLFEGIIVVLTHFYKRLYWYAGAVILGLIIGLILNSTSEKSYGANMYVKTNFNSGRQVYENIKQLHQLASVDQDTEELGRILNITPSEASELKGFYIKENTGRNIKAKMYSEYRQNLDSVTRSEVTYKDYEESLSDFLLPVHQINVKSTDKFIYKKIEDAFIKELSNNEYLKELSEVNSENLLSEVKNLEDQVNKTDYLIDEYLKIKIAQSKKPESNGTNLYIGDAESGKSEVSETELLKERLRLEKQKRNAKRELVEERDVISVISGFPSSGYDAKDWTDKKYYTIPLLFFFSTLFIFVLIGLGKFLKEREKGKEGYESIKDNTKKLE